MTEEDLQKRCEHRLLKKEKRIPMNYSFILCICIGCKRQIGVYLDVDYKPFPVRTSNYYKKIRK